MPRSSNPQIASVKARDPRVLIRVILGVLLGLNLIAAGFMLFPPGGSAEQMEEQLAALQSQVASRNKIIEVTRQHVAAVEKGRSQGDQFLGTYFLARRTAYSTLLGQLGDAAQQSQIKAREISYATEPIEGSDTLSMMTITASYEGTYQDLMNFVHQVDQSPGLMIIESLSAAPQSGAQTGAQPGAPPGAKLLSVTLKLDTFVREDAGE